MENKMFRVFFTIFVVFSVFLSCNSEKQDDSNDRDVLSDSITENDKEGNISPDLKQDIDIAERDDNDVDLDSKDDVEIKDEDVESDESTDEKPDASPDGTETPDYDYPAGTDGDPDCPSLLNPGFPYEDKDGKITFCRKCDLPAPANDPQCIRNLWEMNNRRIVEEYPDEYCYPLPCDVTDKAIKNDAPTIGKCDFDAESKIYHNSTGVFKQGDIWDGKIGMYAATGKKVDGKYIVIGSLLYEISTKKYTMVSWSTSKQSYKNDRFIFLTGNTYDMKSYLASAKKTDSGWKYEFIYKNEWNSVEFIYPPAIGENYVLMNVTRANDSGPKEILYASVDDWNWKKLGEGTIIYSQIYNDKAFFNYDSSVWSCDLTKSPTNIETDCRKVNQDGIQATSPAVKKDNPNLVIYTAEAGYRQLYMANLTNAEIVYTKLNLEISPDLISFAPGQWDGDILALGELYQFSEVDVDYRMCYYSISKDKKVCFPNPNEHQAPMGYIYGGVEGKYITYQPTGAIFLRDMECYCAEYPDQCLYDEYLPETTIK
jgi:hypothetical protein